MMALGNDDDVEKNERRLHVIYVITEYIRYVRCCIYVIYVVEYVIYAVVYVTYVVVYVIYVAVYVIYVCTFELRTSLYVQMLYLLAPIL